MVYILLGNGFEEIEAVTPADLLRRAGVETVLVGVDGKTVTGAHGIQVGADILVPDINLEELEMLVLPGGKGGVDSIRANRDALDLIREVHARGRYLAAICAAPLILAEQGFLDRRNATCFPGLEEEMGSTVTATDASLVIDGRMITGRAPGTAIEFGLALVRMLRGVEASKRVQEEIHYENK
ncbi:MAG: DJ-1/PfpI family protein [Oscillospiraceae bacterium]|jgi:4-methyl-5(b-hydroxyethyl)-thiazole monophosphate biosynthesis|nr:DJ-1/PfpI family protein [Oscillospiraceae bacterium]